MDGLRKNPGCYTRDLEEEEGYVVFDLEATGLHAWYGDRVTCICARDHRAGCFQLASEDEPGILLSFVDWLRLRPPGEHLLVTKNGKQFDVPFILARMVLLNMEDRDRTRLLLSYEHLDLHELTSRWVTLDDMARLLKCTPKTGTGEGAIGLWREKKLEELASYCMQDVRTTEEVFLTWRRL
jgi:uncharacterized protein YprB with RNaseH-like and TPR domain